MKQSPKKEHSSPHENFVQIDVSSNKHIKKNMKRLRRTSIKFDQAVHSNVRWNDMVLTKKTVLCMVVSVLVITIGIIRLVLSENSEHHARRTETLHLGSQYAHTLERQLKTSIFSTHALASFVSVDNHNVTRDNFESIALKLMESFGGITNLQLAPNGIVSDIIPLAGNAAAIGHDLLMDPNRRTGSLATITSEKVTFVGPLTLIQGGFAVIARNPVFTNYANPPAGRETFNNSAGVPFWGFTTMLALVDTLLEPVNLDSLEAAGYSWQLVNTAKNSVFAASTDIETSTQLTSPIMIKVEFAEANVKWLLSLAPRGGWPKLSAAFWQLMFLLAATIGFAAWSVYRTLERESKLERVQCASKEFLPMMHKTLSNSFNENDAEQDDEEEVEICV